MACRFMEGNSARALRLPLRSWTAVGRVGTMLLVAVPSSAAAGYAVQAPTVAVAGTADPMPCKFQPRSWRCPGPVKRRERRSVL